jgi:hypothetical protein
MAGLTLPTLLAAQAQVKAVNEPPDDTAVIQVWLGYAPDRSLVRPQPKAKFLRSDRFDRTTRWRQCTAIWASTRVSPSSTTPVVPCRSCPKAR